MIQSSKEIHLFRFLIKIGLRSNFRAYVTYSLAAACIIKHASVFSPSNLKCSHTPLIMFRFFPILPNGDVACIVFKYLDLTLSHQCLMCDQA